MDDKITILPAPPRMLRERLRAWLRSVKAFCDDFCWAMMLSHPTEIDVPLGREEAENDD